MAETLRLHVMKTEYIIIIIMRALQSVFGRRFETEDIKKLKHTDSARQGKLDPKTWFSLRNMETAASESNTRKPRKLSKIQFSIKSQNYLNIKETGIYEKTQTQENE